MGEERNAVTDDDLAIMSSMERLATLPKRAGYVEAMQLRPTGRVVRGAMLASAAGCGALVYACKLYVSAAWLRWFLIILFGALGVGFVLAWIGMMPKLVGHKWGVAVVGKRCDDEIHRVTFLRENGERHELVVGTTLYRLLKPGDLGVVHCSGDGPAWSVDGFTRL